MNEPLKIMTWDHRRGRGPIDYAALWWQQKHPNDRIEVYTRSLADFEHYPIGELAREYDLVLYDHPFVGTVAHSRVFVPLDEWMDAEFLGDQAGHSVGPSFASYRWDDHQWGLAIDAASQVSARRQDLFEDHGLFLPKTWDQVAELFDRGVALALNPTHVFATLLTLTAGLGDGFRGDVVDWEPFQDALNLLKWLWGHAHPMSRSSSPIEILEYMSCHDDVVYSPLIFGYVNYAHPGYRSNLVRFGPIPAPSGIPAGAILGGVGLGVSAARGGNRALALTFAEFLASPGYQSGSYFSQGGQPGYLAAWQDPIINRAASGFFEDTLEVLEGSYVRPRFAGYQTLQRQGEQFLHQALTQGESHRAIVRGLESIFAAKRE